MSGLEDLTITTTELTYSLLRDGYVSKYNKQEQFKEQHRPATLGSDTYSINNKINLILMQIQKYA